MKEIEISHSGFELTKDIVKYVEKKAESLIKFVPRRQRQSLHFEFKLKEEQGHKKNKCTAEMVLRMPHARLTAEESTINIFAAIDIIDAKMASQLRKFKEQEVASKKHRNSKIVHRIRILSRKRFWKRRRG